MGNTKNLVRVALFAALIAVGAFIRSPVPVCPFTLQFLFTMLAGLLLGGKYGALSVLVYLCVGLLGLPVFAKLLDIPKYFLLPVVMVCCVVGAYCANFSIFDVWCVAVFGLIGLGFKYLKVPSTPMIIGFILGPMTEENFRQALMQTGGHPSIFFTRPLSLIFLLIAAASVAMTIRKQVIARKK